LRFISVTKRGTEPAAATARSEPGALTKAGWLAGRTVHHLVGLVS
jgi:hypothetical protein